jgi:hypothetical protein
MVRGRFVGGGVGANGAYSQIYLEGAEPHEVEEMLTQAHPRRFFPTATMENRRVTAHGQEGDENPLGAITGHANLMHTRIRREGNGRVRGEFSGFLNGQAPVKIERVRGGTLVTEQGTEVRPDFTQIPIAGRVQREFENRVPFFGQVARGMRHVGEEMASRMFEAAHVGFAATTAPEAMAEAINQKRRTGRW